MKRRCRRSASRSRGSRTRQTRLGAFTIARIVEAKQHPDADRLRVCQVEIKPGEPTVEVVCGAPNAKAGLIGVFGPIGTFIPGTGITLEKRPVRGIDSNGMMLSERELELSDDHDGIIELDPGDRASVSVNATSTSPASMIPSSKLLSRRTGRIVPAFAALRVTWRPPASAP